MVRLLAIIAAAFALLLAVFIGRIWFGTRTGPQPKRPNSTAANDGATSLGAEWRAEVVLEQLSERNPDYEINRLKIVLRDRKGKEVETPDTQFELNGVALSYRVGQGNYYDRHPYYRLIEDSDFHFAADFAYELAMRHANGPASPFATVRTPKPMSPDSFRVPVTHPSNRDLVISWAGLSQPADLLIYKTHTFIDAQGNQAIEAGGPYADDALRQRIGSSGLPLGEGRYTIPASYLATAAGRRVTAVGIEITAQNTGRFLHPILKDSSVTAIRKVVLRIDVAPPQHP